MAFSDKPIGKVVEVDLCKLVGPMWHAAEICRVQATPNIWLVATVDDAVDGTTWTVRAEISDKCVIVAWGNSFLPDMETAKAEAYAALLEYREKMAGDGATG